MRGRRLISGGGVAALLVLAGCGRILGVDDYRVSGTAAPRDASGADGGSRPGYSSQFGGLSFSLRGCRDCMDAQCSSEETACAANPTCHFHARCTAACAPEDFACRGRCAGLSVLPQQSTERSELIHCQATLCGSQCGTACPGSQPYPFGQACARCMAEQCCAETTAFVTDLDAMDKYACNLRCQVPSPDVCGCEGSTGVGAPVIATWNQCYQTACSAACGEPDWSCLGSAVWLPAAQTVTKMRAIFQARDPLSGALLPNLDVKLCSAGDPECVSPLTPIARPDPSGIVSFDLDSSTIGWTSWPFGYVDARGEGIPDSLVYFFPPFTRTRALPLNLLTSQLTDSILKNLPGAGDPARGHVLLTVFGCSSPGPGVVVTTPGTDASVVYFSGLNYDLARTETDDKALVGIVNVPPGPLRVDGTVKATGQHLATVHVQIRPGAGTYFDLYPGPE